MPDLITHVALSHILRRPFDRGRRMSEVLPFRVLFYLGIILPDILTRPWYILFPVTHNWTLCFHTPLGMGLTAGILAMFFESSIRKIAFKNLTLGAGTHFILDTLQKKITGDNYWFFPVTWKSVEHGIAWAEDYVDLIPLWLGLVLLVEFVIYLWNKKGT